MWTGKSFNQSSQACSWGVGEGVPDSQACNQRGTPRQDRATLPLSRCGRTQYAVDGTLLAVMQDFLVANCEQLIGFLKRMCKHFRILFCSV